MQKLDLSQNKILEEKIQLISKLFPNVMKESAQEDEIPENVEILHTHTHTHTHTTFPINKKIDFELLKQELADYVLDDSKERYSFEWKGKRQSIALSNMISHNTLRPVKDESVDFDNTKNLYIEGDNLEVLKVLRHTYMNKVKMIYIDPPYNTGKDFVYRDRFAQNEEEYKKDSIDYDEENNKMISNPDTSGKYHTNWLNMIYPRLKIARDLLTEDGVIFISIDDNEQANLKKVCDEIFGEENFISENIWQNKEGGGKSDSKFFRQKHEYIIIYAKNIKNTTICPLPVKDEERYKYEDEFVKTRGKYQLIKLDSGSLGWVKSLDYPIELDGHIFYAGGSKEKWIERQNGGNATKDWGWRWSKEKLKWGIENNFIEIKQGSKGEWNIYTKQYFNCDKDGNIIDGRRIQPLAVIENYSTTQANKDLKMLFGSAIFNYSKPKELLEYLINLVSSENDIILDFFSGSATTAHAVMELNAQDNRNRKYIMVQLNEHIDLKDYVTICEIGKERIRRAGNNIKKELEEKNEDTAKLDIGFRVLRLDTSNIKDNTKFVQEYQIEDIQNAIDTVKQGRDNLDLLFEIMLAYNIELSEDIQEIDIQGKKIYAVQEYFLMACFENDINEELIKAMADKKPQYVVIKQGNMQDKDLINIENMFKTYKNTQKLEENFIKII